MTDVVTADRPKRGSKGNGAAHGPVLVSGVKLALHLGCIRQNIDQLTRQGVIERRASDGLFDQDQCRLRYITHLRSERRSQRSAADTEFTTAKAELLRIRIAEKKRELVRQDEVDALIDSLMACCSRRCRACPRSARRVVIWSPGARSNRWCSR